MSQRSRERLRRMREARQRDAENRAAQNAIKLAGFGAALLVFLAVAVGFRGPGFDAELARRFEPLAPLLEPVLFRITGLELAALALAGIVGALVAWRRLRR